MVLLLLFYILGRPPAAVQATPLPLRLNLLPPQRARRPDFMLLDGQRGLETFAIIYVELRASSPLCTLLLHRAPYHDVHHVFCRVDHPARRQAATDDDFRLRGAQLSSAVTMSTMVILFLPTPINAAAGTVHSTTSVVMIAQKVVETMDLLKGY